MAPSRLVARRDFAPALVLALITDAATVAYGLWTIVSTLTVLLGGSTHTGLNPGALACVGLIVAGAIAVARKPEWVDGYARWADARSGDAQLVLAPRSRVLMLATVAGAIALWLVTRSLVGVWGLALVGYWAATGIGLFRTAEPARELEPSDDELAGERVQLWIVHGLAVLCALFTLVSIRPRTDDPFYLSMSVSVGDYPDAPLLAARTLHGPPNDTLAFQPMFLPYKVHSFEVLGGYIAYLTGLDVSAVVHFGLATLFAWLVPFALTRLLRWLVPRGWLFALIATLTYLAIDGSAGRGYANQAFVRMFNGKAAMLSLALPLILYYGLRLGAQPSVRAFALLAFAQIMAMGMSSTGIWLAPMLAVLAVAAGTLRARELPKTLALATLSSSYVLAMGVWIFFQMPTDSGVVTTGLPPPTGAPTEIGAANLAFVIPEVLGGERIAIGLLTVFTLAWVLARGLVAFRLLAYLGVVLLTVLINPWLTNVVGRLITGSITYERVFWLIPVPLSIGLFAAHAKQWLELRRSSREAMIFVAALLVAFYATSVERTVIGESNRAWLSFPPVLKVWPMARGVAEALCKIAPRGNVILASEAVSQQLVTIQGCGQPVIAGFRWMSAVREEKWRRINLQRYVSVYNDLTLEREPDFRRDIDRYHVVAIAMNQEGLRNRQVKAVLRDMAYKKIGVVDNQHIWFRRLRSHQAR